MFPLKKLMPLLLPLPLVFAACARHSQGGMNMPPAPVIVQKIETTSVADMSEYVATLISRRSVTLQSQVAGQVTAIYVKAGDVVSQGAPLMLVDPSRQQAVLSSASAAAASQQAQISQARESLRVLEEQRAALQSSVQTAQSQYDRYAGLVAMRSASQQEVERFKNELSQAQAALQANEAQIAAQKAAIKTSERMYEQARAASREQQVQLQYHRITAPFSGVVGDIPVKLGNTVQPLANLLSVTDNNPLEVNIRVPAERAPDLRKGLAVEILSETGSLLGSTTLSFVSPQVDEDSQTVLTKAVLPNPDGRLKADQIINARIIWKKAPGVRIPTESVVHMGGRDFVYVAESAAPNQFVARQKPVTLGRIEGSFYIVESGLKPGDALVVSGIQKLRDAAPIVPQK